MAGRFPGASNISEFWENLRNGIESIRQLTESEAAALGAQPRELQSSDYVRAVASMPDEEYFDASFFGITHRDADVMDPQHRVLLECAWEALENAGYDSFQYQGSIGIFAGATINTYLILNLAGNPNLMESLDEAQVNISNGPDFLTTRISYKLNLRGPSHGVQSACSTSLVAIHLACQNLLDQECDMALAGGVSINVRHRHGYRHVQGGITSPDGHCRPFDARAQGTVFGNGAGMVVLKRLQDAVSDRDNIHAIIKGSAINNDGALKVGYTAPGVEGQAKVIAQALACAGVAPRDISYVEAHGTATSLGDPVEIQALTKAFRARADGNSFCAIGSVKGNVGHLDAAAGVTGLIKTVLALKNRLLPPSLHYTEPNPNIDFEATPFYVNPVLSEWKAERGPRRAGVSAFGVGGTNAHIVLEEAPAAHDPQQARPWALVTLSARTESSLETVARNLRRFLQEATELNLADVAYTLQVGRKALAKRATFTCRHIDDAVRALGDFERTQARTIVPDAQPVFLFPGQGSQYVNMARGLLPHEPEFRQNVDLCSELLRSRLGFDLRLVLFPSDSAAQEASRVLRDTQVAQPALFVIEYALAKVWLKWGVLPYAMIGHSIGEYVAACLAEVFGLEDALTLVCARGRLMQALAPGIMLAVSLDEEKVKSLLQPGISIAAVNGADQTVVSGGTGEIAEMEQLLTGMGIFCIRLKTSHAFHSDMMGPAVEPFVKEVSRVKLSAPKFKYISNITGNSITDDEARNPEYWGRHLTSTVRFHDGVREILKGAPKVLLEVGPDDKLTRLVKAQKPHLNPAGVVASLNKHDQDDFRSILQTAGRLWELGLEIDWDGYYGSERRSRVPLPSYPFERQRYWIEGEEAPSASLAQPDLRLEADPSKSLYIPIWKSSPAPDLSGLLDSMDGQGIWVLFSADTSLCRELLKMLNVHRQVVVVVKTGGGFRRERDGSYLIDPASAADFGSLVRELCGREGIEPCRILYLWSFSPPGSATLRVSQITASAGLLFLAHSLRQAHLFRTVALTIVTNHLANVAWNREIAAEKGMILAACTAIPLAQPEISCRCIDVYQPDLESEQIGGMASQIISEIIGSPADFFVAYCGKRRYVESFERLQIEQETRESETEPFHFGTRYLIVNGLSKPGAQLARQLSHYSGVQLLMLEPLAAPTEQERLAGLTERSLHENPMEATGSNPGACFPSVIRLNLSDEGEVKDVLARFLPGGLNGVVYMSRAADEKAENHCPHTPEMNPTEDAHRVTQLLSEFKAIQAVLKGVVLDFRVVSCPKWSRSSVTEVAAPNLVDIPLESMVWNHNSGSSPPWLLVNWDPEEWEAEEGAKIAETGGYRRDRYESRMVAAFKQALKATRKGIVDRVILSRSKPPNRIPSSRAVGQPASRPPSGATSRAQTHPRPRLANPYVPPSTEMERAIAAIWRQAFSIDAVGLDDNFFDLGGDSLTAITVAAQLKQALRTDSPVVNLYEALTIKKLVELLKDKGPGNSSGEDPERIELEASAAHRKAFQQKQRAKRIVRSEDGNEL
jgi:phthiocerol/phenolphthiocerol synthesis type-I polyketide synthase E